jgi:hypothetical protein
VLTAFGNGSLVATRAGGLVLRGIALASTDAPWESKLVSAARDPDVERVLPLAARNALVELLLEDLAAPRPRGSLIARAAALLTLAPGARLGAARDHDERAARSALRAAGLLAWSSPAVADEPPSSVVRVTAAWEPLVAARLRSYQDALAHARRGRDLATRLAQARVLFAVGLFFEVHEVLEPPWQMAVGREREFLQGVIQAAVAWHHAAHGNSSGALRLATSSCVKLADAPDAWLGFPLGALRGSVESFVGDLSVGEGGAAPALPWARADAAS